MTTPHQADANGVDVQIGTKFAILALPDVRGGGAPAPLVPLSHSRAVTTTLPQGTLDTWQNSLGQFHVDELRATSFFLWSMMPSQRPEVLDDENEILRERVYDLYLGVLIAIPYFSNDRRMTFLTGGNEDGTTRVRSLTTYPRTWYSAGTPMPLVSLAKLQLAGRIAGALQTHTNDVSHRIVRAVRAFRQATEASDLDVRLHQFVRCAEAFSVPSNAKQFAKRLAHLCAGLRYPGLKELYAIRSKIEHLHGPFQALPAYLSKRAKHLRLLQRCLQAEVLARFLLSTYFQHPALWPHFESRDKIQQFWRLPPSAFRRLWPRRLAFRAALRQFEADDAIATLGRAGI